MLQLNKGEINWLFRIGIIVSYIKTEFFKKKIGIEGTYKGYRYLKEKTTHYTYPCASLGAYCHFSPSSLVTITVHMASYIFISVGAKHTGISRVDFGPTRIPPLRFSSRQNGELGSSDLPFSESSRVEFLSTKKKECFKVILPFYHNFILWMMRMVVVLIMKIFREKI